MDSVRGTGSRARFKNKGKRCAVSLLTVKSLLVSPTAPSAIREEPFGEVHERGTGVIPPVGSCSGEKDLRSRNSPPKGRKKEAPSREGGRVIQGGGSTFHSRGE